MTNAPKFSIVSKSTNRNVAAGSTTEKQTTKFIKTALKGLESGEWLVMDTHGDAPWPILLGLEDEDVFDECLESAVPELFDLVGPEGSSGQDLPTFQFELSRLVLRSPKGSRLPEVCILARYGTTLFLACERGWESENGVVTLGDLASYSWLNEYTSSPISWSGGAVLSQVNPYAVLSIGTGDSEFEPEEYYWPHQTDMTDSQASTIAAWLSENGLTLAFAWNRVKPNPKYFSQKEIDVFGKITKEGPLWLTLSFDAHEQRQIEEHLPKLSPLYFELYNAIEVKGDWLLWELFLYHGMSGMLFDGGGQLEESFQTYSKARQVIRNFYLPTDWPAPDLYQTTELVQKLEKLQAFEQSEIERILLENEDRLLRTAPARLKKALGKQVPPLEYLQVLQSAFKTWLEWQELRTQIPMLIDETLGE